ncbi:MAG: FKBP-type peptidyl-prolyl cis-trans isomerase N-terminal domain-containing protein, partial [Methanococcaceae archaeon]
MKAKIIAVLVFFSAGLAFGQQGEIKKSDLKGPKEKVSYSIGLDIGKNLKKQSIEVDPQVLIQGIKDGINRDSLYLLTESEIQETMMAFQKELYAKQTEKAKMIGEKNKKEGEACLTENKNKEGVKTTASGLQYKVIKAG